MWQTAGSPLLQTTEVSKQHAEEAGKRNRLGCREHHRSHRKTALTKTQRLPQPSWLGEIPPPRRAVTMRFSWINTGQVFHDCWYCASDWLKPAPLPVQVSEKSVCRLARKEDADGGGIMSMWREELRGGFNVTALSAHPSPPPEVLPTQSAHPNQPY